VALQHIHDCMTLISLFLIIITPSPVIWVECIATPYGREWVVLDKIQEGRKMVACVCVCVMSTMTNHPLDFIPSFSSSNWLQRQ